MDEQIMQAIGEVCGVDASELATDTALFDEGLLDSFGVVQLMLKLEERLGLTLDIENFARESIATPALIVELLKGLAS
jgi:D-alanine--poly(phosphoribitol) ligase subunit 2